MSEGFLRRQDVGYPRLPNPRAIYAVRYFEDYDPVILADLVNIYLLELPTATATLVPHLVSSEFGYKGAGHSAKHFCWLTLYAAGTITSSPGQL